MPKHPIHDRRAELYALVTQIPPGRVVGYGQIGRELSSPLSGLLVGRMMFEAPFDIPWHRVVGADGSLKIAKRGPDAAVEQRTRLEAEGVAFTEDGKVARSFFWEF